MSFYLFLDDMYNCEDVNIVTREQWRARNAMRNRRIHLPVNHIVILHTVTKFCNSRQQCSRAVQFIQDLHLDDRGKSLMTCSNHVGERFGYFPKTEANRLSQTFI
ncbi:hypothetical protein AVEN_236330-1 [Araneus ventricosus]|uniref:Uncharacterized protein n=1 Tax=Araneus ventricosus TaxID=182803 RepID=A0A4Y2ESL5_ARAVE|nr:hypothetical protein AVEN_236330-1 [Araneus ventricosus]